MLSDICLILKNFVIKFEDQFISKFICKNKIIDDFLFENIKNRINAKDCLDVLNQLLRLL